MSRIAIIGGGVAGLSLAYFLRQKHELTLYDKNDYWGGHANTVDVLEDSRRVPIDTGFMVFNHATYPNLLQLFDELDVETKKTDMSFSVQETASKLEYSGASLGRLFGDPKNIFNARFWSLLLQIDRFNREGMQALEDDRWKQMSLHDYALARGHSSDFLHHYLIPMSGAIWSTPPEKMLSFPVYTLLRFFKNHGLLGVSTHHQWWTVEGGSKQYVNKILTALDPCTKILTGVASVCRGLHKVEVVTSDGIKHSFDHVVLACHADEALALLDDASPKERELLGAFKYQRNETLLHTDTAVMPVHRKCWASWNYRIDSKGASTHYWMNSLQDVSKKQQYFVTLNGSHLVSEEKILKRMTYHHPLFDLKSLQAQADLPLLNQASSDNRVFFCGSYFGFGFHEDALVSSINLAKILERVPCR